MSYADDSKHHVAQSVILSRASDIMVARNTNEVDWRQHGTSHCDYQPKGRCG